MIRLRLAILGVAGALAIGTASVLAMTETGVGDNHGALVSSAARSCPHGASGVHGACVSAVASTNGQAHRDGQQSARVHACLAANFGHDKPGRAAFKACVHSTTPTAPPGS